MDKLTINLFALTGFGNVALNLIMKEFYTRVEILALYTRKDNFPYYQEESLSELARKQNVPVYCVPEKGYWKVHAMADLNLVSTFHRIFRRQHLASAKLAINIHPSLLPSYQGPTPTNWVVHNRERVTGITAHLISEEVDKGPIVYQKSYEIDTCSDSRLRLFLAQRSADTIRFILQNYPKYEIRPAVYPASVYPNYYKVFD